MRIRASDLASLLQADLEAAGWNGANHSYPGQTPRQYALMSLSKSLTKKYLPGTSGTTPETDAKALSLFTKVNSDCLAWRPKHSEAPSWLRIALGEAKAFLWDFFYPVGRSRESWNGQDFVLSLHEICKGLALGPGSSIGAPSEDCYSKLALSDMSTSSSALYDLYVQAIRHIPTWADCEFNRSQRLGVRICRSSRLSFVPKTAEISRTICTEPLLNMMFQKGIASVLERRMRQVLGIDLADQQSKNQRFAWVGSVNGDYGTIDLSSASDSMSLALVREFFPPSVVLWLERTRTKSTILPDGTELELHMISSMGNAFTFPLQTIFFSALVYGAYRALDIPIKISRGRSFGNFAVNGDDIIVTKGSYDLVCEMLAFSGFKVNVDKSFNEGLFRESCGSDFYQGYNVRGVYIKSLRDASDCYSAINRLNRWSARHSVPLPRLVQYLSSKVRFLPVPYDEGDAQGLKVPRALSNLWKTEKHTGGLIYRCISIAPRLTSVEPPAGKSPKLRGWYENPSGLLMAFLAGSIRNGSIGHRILDRKIRVRRRFSSRWDYIFADQDESPGFVERWKSFVGINLGKI
jgi:hypothetical protein